MAVGQILSLIDPAYGVDTHHGRLIESAGFFAFPLLHLGIVLGLSLLLWILALLFSLRNPIAYFLLWAFPLRFLGVLYRSIHLRLCLNLSAHYSTFVSSLPNEC